MVRNVNGEIQLDGLVLDGAALSNHIDLQKSQWTIQNSLNLLFCIRIHTNNTRRIGRKKHPRTDVFHKPKTYAKFSSLNLNLNLARVLCSNISVFFIALSLLSLPPRFFYQLRFCMFAICCSLPKILLCWCTPAVIIKSFTKRRFLFGFTNPFQHNIMNRKNKEGKKCVEENLISSTSMYINSSTCMRVCLYV